MWMSFSVSPSSSRSTGMPVQRATTMAMSSSSTSSFTIDSRTAVPLLELLLERRQLAVADLGDALEVAAAAPRAPPPCFSSSMRRVISLTRSSASFSCAQRAASALRASFASASSRSTGARTSSDSFAIAASSISSWRTRRSASSSSSGDESISMRSRDAASSTRSIALSGRKRSAM